MDYFKVDASRSRGTQIILEPEDWTEGQWATFLDVFGLIEAERIVISDCGVEVMGTPKTPAQRGWLMKLREFNFNSIWARGLCVKEEGASVIDKGRCFEGFIGETLRALPIEWADREIKDTRYYFDIFVIEVEKGD